MTKNKQHSTKSYRELLGTKRNKKVHIAILPFRAHSDILYTLCRPNKGYDRMYSHNFTTRLPVVFNPNVDYDQEMLDNMCILCKKYSVGIDLDVWRAREGHCE